MAVLRLGDAQDVVVELSLDFLGFEWLVNDVLERAMPGDGFTVEMRAVLERLYDERSPV